MQAALSSSGPGRVSATPTAAATSPAVVSPSEHLRSTPADPSSSVLPHLTHDRLEELRRQLWIVVVRRVVGVGVGVVLLVVSTVRATTPTSMTTGKKGRGGGGGKGGGGGAKETAVLTATTTTSERPMKRGGRGKGGGGRGGGGDRRGGGTYTELLAGVNGRLLLPRLVVVHVQGGGSGVVRGQWQIPGVPVHAPHRHGDQLNGGRRQRGEGLGDGGDAGLVRCSGHRSRRRHVHIVQAGHHRGGGHVLRVGRGDGGRRVGPSATTSATASSIGVGVRVNSPVTSYEEKERKC